MRQRRYSGMDRFFPDLHEEETSPLCAFKTGTHPTNIFANNGIQVWIDFSRIFMTKRRVRFVRSKPERTLQFPWIF
jgi:hypothetical protein